MAPQARLLSSIFVGLIALCSCSRNTDRDIRFVNRERAVIETREGITYVNDSIFTGVLYSLMPNMRDTIELTFFKNGKQDGLALQRYPNGNLEFKRFYVNGEKSGKLLAWWDNGQKRLEYNFENGEYEGVGMEWAPNGTLIKKLNYKKGYEDGLQQLWTADGELWANFEVRNGRHYGITGVKSCATLWKDDSVSTH